MASFAILGATSWGLTLASLLRRNRHDVRVLVRSDAEAAQLLERRGLDRLPGLVLDPAVSFVSAAVAPIDGCQGLVAAVPAQGLRLALDALDGSWEQVSLLGAAKGIELTTGLRPAEVAQSCGWRDPDIAALSGPNLSHEIVRGLPAAAVVASRSDAHGRLWQEALAGPTFRVYRSEDVAGVELAGAMKNVIAIAAGAAWGMGFGANTVAALVTRGLAEIARLGMACGADQATFLGLAGVGDLTATCFSPLSRNRRFGELLAAGLSPEDALSQVGEAVEGVGTARVAVELGRRLGVDLPITAQVAAVVEGRASIPEAMAGLLSRDLTVESGR